MAIAFDNSSSVVETNGTGTATISGFAVSATNPVIVVSAFRDDTATAWTSIKYNGVSMTKVVETNFGGTRFVSVWALTGNSGTHDIVALTSGNGTIEIGAVSFTGALQGAADSSGSNTVTGGATNTVTLTTVANNCALVGSWWHNASYSSVGTNTTLVANDAPGSDRFTVTRSTANVTPAGSTTQAITVASGSANQAGAVAAFAPAPDTTSGNFLAFM
jgi:hypothetical protein